MRSTPRFVTLCVVFCLPVVTAVAQDPAAILQSDGIQQNATALGHWGLKSDQYSEWTNHSNRLIPVYSFGTGTANGAVNLKHYTGANSPYRSEEQLRRIYGRVPERTLNENAVWMDQTNVADIQRAAVAAGKKHIFLVVFDGMDWQTTRAAAIYNTGRVGYRRGKGNGTHFQNYDANGTAQFGFMCTSPHNDGTKVDVDAQSVQNPGGSVFGGYDAAAGGAAPWQLPTDAGYLIAKPAEQHTRHAFTDSASSATSMMAGIKTYNNAIGVDPQGAPVAAIAHELQEEGWSVGAVSSVPISHATPASAYSHNVTRKDYQDISRDLLGLPSIAHPDQPLPGLDVVIGGGFGSVIEKDSGQGANFEPGNKYLADSDLVRSDVRNGGRYVTAVSTEGQNGAQLLQEAANQAIKDQKRLLGFFGIGRYSGHLPYQTANGDFKPVRGVAKEAEAYTEEELTQNPELHQMTTAAIQVLQKRSERFWLLVEAGDVDWANHDNNIDNAIGAVNSGDAAVKVITDWVEQNSSWDDALVIVTADHGHLFQFSRPALLAKAVKSDAAAE